ncbi:MAG: glycosyltransferase family 2 protein [Chitinophagaceae bacterium]
MIQFILQLVFLIVYVYLAVSTCYLLVLALFGKRLTSFQYTAHYLSKKKIAVLIPAYKEDSIIFDTAKKACRHNYPGSFQVIVIADSLKKQTIEKLRSLPVQVIEVWFEVSTKAKSIHAALRHIKNEGVDIVVLLDADNVMEDNCLEIINGSFHNGCKAVQCHRIAKNEDTPIALLGAISEAININLFRRGPTALGLSAAPLGSGMAFEFGLINQIFEAADILENPAEDREIEIQLMKRKIRFEFLNDAYVYDEKVTDAGAFETQRVRWLEAQVNHIRRFYKPDLKNTPKTPLYYHIFFQNFLLPRVLYIFAACCVIFVLLTQVIFDFSLIYPGNGWWIGWMASYFLVLLFSIPFKFYTFKTLRAIAFIPVLIISMLKAMLKMKKNRKEFLHTSKTFHAK